MSNRHFSISALGRSRAVSLMVMFALLLVAGIGLPGRIFAQDASSTAGHPLVGTWIVDSGTEGPATVSFTSDGIAIDTESTGEVGLGTWTATSATAANATFVLYITDEAAGISGSVIIRVTLDYDEATDTASGPYTVTAVGFDGTVLFVDDGTATATRLPAEGPEMGGSPIPALVTGTPVASPAAA